MSIASVRDRCRNRKPSSLALCLAVGPFGVAGIKVPSTDIHRRNLLLRIASGGLIWWGPATLKVHWRAQGRGTGG